MQGIGAVFHERGLMERAAAELEAAGFDRTNIIAGDWTDEGVPLEASIAGAIAGIAVTAASAGNIGDGMRVARAIDEAADEEEAEQDAGAGLLVVTTTDPAEAERARALMQALGATDICLVD
jgi:hypothetical protein